MEGVEVNKALKDGSTPLFTAARWGHGGVVGLLFAMEAASEAFKRSTDVCPPRSKLLKIKKDRTQQNHDRKPVLNRTTAEI